MIERIIMFRTTRQGWDIYKYMYIYRTSTFPEVTNCKIKLLYFRYQKLSKEQRSLLMYCSFSDSKIKFLCVNWTFSFKAEAKRLLEVNAFQHKILFTKTLMNSMTCIVTSPCCSLVLGFCRCFQCCALKWTSLLWGPPCVRTSQKHKHRNSLAV